LQQHRNYSVDETNDSAIGLKLLYYYTYCNSLSEFRDKNIYD